ncbi:MAG: NUDIX domain-containing protein [Bdellovibrionia bacterium]
MDDKLQQHLFVCAAVATDGDKFFIARRGPGLKESGRWEFPGGKVSAGESFKGALKREIKEELNVDCTVGEPLAVGHFPGGTVVGFRVEFASRPVKSTDHDDLRWVPASEILDLPLAIADYEIAVAAIRHQLTFNRLDVGSAVRMSAGIYFLIGVIAAGGIFFLQTFVQTFFAGYMPPGMGAPPAVGLGAVFLVPVFYAVIGAFGGLIAAGIYNFLSAFLGGLSFEVRRR